ncbi:hypothetical protein SODALDRAFT_361979 [Sodiomyces alkalinus F11]|uniref:Uncharacterized protein n=1 Tax=Sodiomyces alkalinus (strain CBS 110278 / VKM F-3762 / F11) TaxID=1314773 RepID=A0A3N2PNX5_SODAK|nr:hypothetical protein SODALDRAFT_361979 [Sodiomyces alkalinus F11]ROT36212.1 hypothetical protein SODALDRAFT_361979 [Sodiomyces alkalinus F11]
MTMDGTRMEPLPLCRQDGRTMKLPRIIFWAYDCVLLLLITRRVSPPVLGAISFSSRSEIDIFLSSSLFLLRLLRPLSLLILSSFNPHLR